MMPARHQGLLRLFIACALPLLALQSAAAADWQLEKVVELSRHGIRPPTAGNREAIEAATGRPWTEWTTHDGELTGHGYAAVVNKGRAEGQHYRQLGLLQAGCPTAESIYVRASPLQRTRATAQALVDGAFPGCGVAIHYVSGDADPLFQTDKFAATQTDPARQLAAVKEKAGDLAQRRQALAPTIQLLKQAVCQADKLERWRNAKSGERYLRVYFQAQGLDDLRRLQTPDAQHPMLRQEWRQPGCRQTDVGTLCPFQAAITALGQRIDRSSAPAVAMVLP
ncbi:histidine-type phosphatase [Klebsiella pneumoniae]|uniref:histidine-type phosphatase n=1 Tax=Klebsiella pneumoniae TaxID=573 RepID=UPI003CFC5479